MPIDQLALHIAIPANCDMTNSRYLTQCGGPFSVPAPLGVPCRHSICKLVRGDTVNSISGGGDNFC